MGLLDFLVTDGIETKQLTNIEKLPVVIEIIPDKADPQNWIWNWAEDYHAPSSLQSRTKTMEITDFLIINRDTGAAVTPLTETDEVPEHVQHQETGKYYRLVSFEDKSVTRTEVSSITQQGLYRVDENDVGYYSFENPQKGSYMDNDQTVSIGSFSIFEAIRLVVPSGISFDPMISSHSDARILCELRLPFQNTAEIQQGFLKNEPVVTSTESAFYGDIIWNNPPSGLQYLPLTTQGGIYDFEIAAELIARDPSVPPQRVYLGYTDVFQVKLRFINRN